MTVPLIHSILKCRHRIDDGTRFGDLVGRKTSQPGVFKNRCFAVGRIPFGIAAVVLGLVLKSPAKQADPIDLGWRAHERTPTRTNASPTRTPLRPWRSVHRQRASPDPRRRKHDHCGKIVPPMASGRVRVLGVWLGTSVRFVINLTVTPTLYIVSGTSDPLAVGRRISCVSA